MKMEKEEKQAGDGGATSLEDEELARQLHRAIKSSPRISCSLTPLQRKSSVKPETHSVGLVTGVKMQLGLGLDTVRHLQLSLCHNLSHSRQGLAQ
jgi:hypothetical protein